MDTLSYKTTYENKSTVKRDWFVVDAEGQVLGRLASDIARIIRGKHKPSFTKHVNCGDKVIVINADKIRLTGKKMTAKELIRHTGHPGGQRRETPQQILAKKPERLLEHAVKGMLPKSRLGRQIFIQNLYVYAGGEHPHSAQEPKELKF